MSEQGTGDAMPPQPRAVVENRPGTCMVFDATGDWVATCRAWEVATFLADSLDTDAGLGACRAETAPTLPWEAVPVIAERCNVERRFSAPIRVGGKTLVSEVLCEVLPTGGTPDVPERSAEQNATMLADLLNARVRDNQELADAYDRGKAAGRLAPPGSDVATEYERGIEAAEIAIRKAVQAETGANYSGLNQALRIVVAMSIAEANRPPSQPSKPPRGAVCRRCGSSFERDVCAGCLLPERRALDGTASVDHPNAALNFITGPEPQRAPKVDQTATCVCARWNDVVAAAVTLVENGYEGCGLEPLIRAVRELKAASPIDARSPNPSTPPTSVLPVGDDEERAAVVARLAPRAGDDDLAGIMYSHVETNPVPVATATLDSRSQLRRKAVQRGEPMPTGAEIAMLEEKHAINAALLRTRRVDGLTCIHGMFHREPCAECEAEMDAALQRGADESNAAKGLPVDPPRPPEGWPGPRMPEYVTGDLVWYRPSPLMREYAAVVDDSPRWLGSTRVVRLRELDPEYARVHHPGSNRTAVAAAALDCVRARAAAAEWRRADGQPEAGTLTWEDYNRVDYFSRADFGLKPGEVLNATGALRHWLDLYVKERPTGKSVKRRETMLFAACKSLGLVEDQDLAETENG